MAAVHGDETCGETFSDLARDLTLLIQDRKINKATERLERCKEARIDATAHYNKMNNAHAAVYNFVDYLQECITKIHKTVKFAEAYGGTTTLQYDDKPMRFTLELQLSTGKRVYTIKSRGYDYVDTVNR
jgi:hypothetical protein